MKTLKPPKLKQNDLIGIISPSAPITEELHGQLNKGIQTLKDLGFRVRLATNALEKSGNSAGTPQQRIDDLHEMFRDSEVKMILFSQGGCAANHLLDKIDYSLIRENPKIISGISDGTTLLNPIHQKTGLITFHGPDLLWTFGREISPAVLNNMLHTFCGKPIGRLSPDPDWKPMGGKRRPYSGWKCIRRGKGSGPLIGGHLASLINIGFAGYGVDVAGKILFLEGTDTEIPFLEKALHALRLKGVFHEIAGLVVGWFDNIESNADKSRTVADLFAEVTAEANCPILEIGELGHNVQNFVFPIGCQATLDTGELSFSLDESPVDNE